MQEAIFAAGCFWGVQFYYDQVPGVTKTEAGYIGGHTKNPSYEDVIIHSTGHAEAVRLTFNPKKISYAILLKHFFRLHDPTQLNRQGPDIGDYYRSAVFYKDSIQKKLVQKTIKELEASRVYDKPIVTALEPATTFWPAEDDQQKFTERTGRGYCHVDYKPL